MVLPKMMLLNKFHLDRLEEMNLIHCNLTRSTMQFSLVILWPILNFKWSKTSNKKTRQATIKAMYQVHLFKKNHH
jgi:hypothetical protein